MFEIVTQFPTVAGPEGIAPGVLSKSRLLKHKTKNIPVRESRKQTKQHPPHPLPLVKLDVPLEKVGIARQHGGNASFPSIAIGVQEHPGGASYAQKETAEYVGAHLENSW